MPRRCSICDHADIDAINQMLVETAPFRDIASRFAVSEKALRRHAKNHLPATLVKAQDAVEVAQSDNLLDRLLYLNRETLAILKDARGNKEHGLALSAIGRAEKQIELQARLLGQMADVQISTNVLVTTNEWLALRGLILSALDPYPEAKAAVIDAIS